MVELKGNLNYESCVIPVCGATDVMHGKSFFDYAEEAARYFKTAHIILCDTLDVHNLCPNPEMRDETLAIARAMGDRWLRKHLANLEDLFTNVSVLRWDEVKADPTFKDRLSLAEKLYHQSFPVEQWVDKECMTYAQIAAKRRQAQGFTPDIGDLFQRSVNYMIEEIAGTAVYYDLYKAPAVYPGTYFDNPHFFDMNNTLFPHIKLTMPEHISVSFENERLVA